jgi:hypothetical protein
VACVFTSRRTLLASISHYNTKNSCWCLRVHDTCQLCTNHAMFSKRHIERAPSIVSRDRSPLHTKHK